MSIYGSGSIPGDVCLALDQSITEIAGTAQAMAKRTQVGYMQALNSPLNATAEDVQYDQGNGTFRDVRRTYWQRDTQSQVNSFIDETCDTGDERGMLTDTLQICQAVSRSIKITEIQAAALCAGEGGMQGLFQKRIMQAWNALAEQKNTLLLQTQLTNYGTNVSTGNSNAVTKDFIDDTANGQIIANTWAEFLDELRNDNQMMGTPIIVGGSGFWQFNHINGMQCCNDAGVDMNQNAAANGYAFFNDQQIDSVIGANECVVMEPGSVKHSRFLKYRQLINPLRNSGSFSAYEMADGTARGILIDPYLGEPYNFRVYRPDNCAEYYVLKIFQEFDAFYLPSDMYQAADTLTGYNGTLRYILT